VNLLSSLQSRLTSSWSSTSICMMNRLRYEYSDALVERWACWKRYEVNERYALIGEGSPVFSGCNVAKLKQKTLFALAKSYVERRMPISGPGL
jgi:hypothetical protein